MTRIALISAAAIAGVLAAAPVQAKNTQATFQYDPYELTTTEGVADVYERLRLSAKRACEVPSPIQKRQEFDCRRGIEKDLVAQVGNPILSAMHRDAQRRLRLAQAH